MQSFPDFFSKCMYTAKREVFIQFSVCISKMPLPAWFSNALSERRGHRVCCCEFSVRCNAGRCSQVTTEAELLHYRSTGSPDLLQWAVGLQQ